MSHYINVELSLSQNQRYVSQKKQDFKKIKVGAMLKQGQVIFKDDKLIVLRNKKGIRESFNINDFITGGLINE